MVEQIREWTASVLEKFGLPTLLLLGTTWFIILPISNAYKTSLESVAETNKMLKDEQINNDKEDEKRVIQISEHMTRIEGKLDQLLQRK